MNHHNNPESTAPVFYKYDTQQLPSGAPTLTLGKSKGRLLAVTYGELSSAGNYYGEYDELGRVKKSCQQTVNQSQAFSYQMSYEYDLAGALTREVYPSGKEVRMEYTTDGKLAGVKNQATSNYWAGAAPTDATNRLQYSAHGAVSAMKLGNGKWEHTNFNNRLQPIEIGLGTTNMDSSLLKLEYEYNHPGQMDNNGNVLKQKISTGATLLFTQTYEYDQVNRLASATESSTLMGGTSWSEGFSYDRFGNLWVVSSSGMTLSSLTPQSQSAINQTRNQLVASSYDKAGNQKTDGQSRTFDYDAENRQVRFNNGAASYFYDGDGKRVKKVEASGTTIFVYNVSGQLIAEYTTAAPQAQGGGGVSYFTQDHLGSTRVVTDKNGSVKSRRDYLPFGQEIDANLGTNIGGRSSVGGYGVNDGQRKRFTGHQRDDESELDFMGARYCSPTQGRFNSVDPNNAGASSIDPQSWHGFAYARNNPLKYVDPDGLKFRLKDLNGNKIDDYADVDFYNNFIHGKGIKLSGNQIYQNGVLIGYFKRLSVDAWGAFQNPIGQGVYNELSRRRDASLKAIYFVGGANFGAAGISIGGTALTTEGMISLGLGAETLGVESFSLTTAYATGEEMVLGVRELEAGFKGLEGLQKAINSPLTALQRRALLENIRLVINKTIETARNNPRYIQSVINQLANPRFRFLDQVPAAKEALVNALKGIGLKL